MVETSAADASASTCVVERGVKGALVPVGHPRWPWLVDYAAFLLNRGKVVHDGRTPCERCQGQRRRVLDVVFGEVAIWKRPPVTRAMAKQACLWEEGICLGVEATSGEYTVGYPKGVMKTRAISRKAGAREVGAEGARHDRRRPAEIERIWPRDGRRADEYAGVREVEWRISTEEGGSAKRAETQGSGLEKYGFTERCPGCRSVVAGGNRRRTARRAGSEF